MGIYSLSVVPQEQQYLFNPVNLETLAPWDYRISNWFYSPSCYCLLSG